MNRRTAKLIRMGDSFGVVLPRDWVRGQGLLPRDLLEIQYDRAVLIRSVKKRASADGERNPVSPAAQPARPAVTDDGGIVRESG